MSKINSSTINTRSAGKPLEHRLRLSNAQDFLDAVNNFYSQRSLFLRNHVIPAEALRINTDSLPNDRGLVRLFHGLIFLHDFCSAYEKTGDIKCLSTGLSIAKDRITTFGSDLAPPVHHDETTAVRVNSLLRLQIFADKEKFITDWLCEFLQSEATLLESDSFHATGNNHGMFQDFALLNYYEHIGVDSIADKARMVSHRLLRYFKESFTPEGVHKENSPAYHSMIHRYLKNLPNYLAFTLSKDNASFLERINLLAEVFGSAVTLPNGNFILWGDTARMKSPYTPIPNNLVFPNSGYAIFSSTFKGQDGTNVDVRCGFKASYQTDYHKHSDDLSIFLFANREVLTDSGAFGYNYSDEKVKYAYSSRAHNTLTVPAIELPRVDGKYDCVKLIKADLDGVPPVVEGLNSRWGSVCHRRRLLQMSPCEFTVEDLVQTDRMRDFELWWHLGEGLCANLDRNQVKIFDLNSGDLIAELKFNSSVQLSAEVVAGCNEPVEGWIFPQFSVAVPTTSIVIRFQGNEAIKINIRVSIRNSTAVLKF